MADEQPDWANIKTFHDALEYWEACQMEEIERRAEYDGKFLTAMLGSKCDTQADRRADAEQKHRTLCKEAELLAVSAKVAHQLVMYYRAMETKTEAES